MYSRSFVSLLLTGLLATGFLQGVAPGQGSVKTDQARLHAALTRAQNDDAQAVSTLIALLGELGDPKDRATVEDFLIGLAGELGPKVRLSEK
jgi:hypothetical protein